MSVWRTVRGSKLETVVVVDYGSGPEAFLHGLNYGLYHLPGYDSNPMNIWPDPGDPGLRHWCHACVRRSFVMDFEIDEG